MINFIKWILGPKKSITQLQREAVGIEGVRNTFDDLPEVEKEKFKLVKAQLTKITVTHNEYLFMEFPANTSSSVLSNARKMLKQYHPALADRTLMYASGIKLTKVKLKDLI